MSVFDRGSFADPPNRFRPLQIVHGLDRFLTDPEALSGEQGIEDHLEKLVEMGTGGIVANVGFTDYLVSPRQWEVLRYGLQKADDLGLVLWWYDEKGYPSGTAGGMVTRAHPEHVAIGLACYTVEAKGATEVRFDLPPSCRACVWAGAVANPANATSDAVIDLCDRVDEWGTLRWQAPSGAWTVVYLAERVMYEGTHATRNVCDFKHYVNLLKPEAVKAFLRVTHERYLRELPPELWQKFVAVFTDEPSFLATYQPELPERFQGKIPVVDAPIFVDRPPAVPWVEDLLDRFSEIKGYDLRPHLFQLFFSEAAEACYVRQDYYDVITRLYTEAFYVQILRWCQGHGIASSGHVMAEESLLSHVEYHGSLFSVIRQMDLPGIDMLNADPQDMLDGQSFMAAKQVASVAHLTGRQQVHSESCDWQQRNEGRFASLAERLGQGNLQYVLGINQITSYYAWQEVGAEGWRQYNDYMGRLASLLTGGCHVCDVAVLYPIRTMWAHHLPSLELPVRGQERAQRTRWAERVSRAYPDLVRHLLRSQIDLDILDEEAIVSAELRDGALCVAGETYRAVILPPVDALALDTVRALAAFCRAGGALFSVGPLPELAESPAHTEILRREVAALFGEEGPGRIVSLEQLSTAVRQQIPADLILDPPHPDVLYTHRQLEGRDIYFLINNAPTAVTLRPTLREPGPYSLYRPLTGAVENAARPLQLELAGYEGVFLVT